MGEEEKPQPNLWELLKDKKGNFTEAGIADAAAQARAMGVSEDDINAAIREYNLSTEKSHRPLFPFIRKRRKN